MRNRNTQARTEAQRLEYINFVRESVLKFYISKYEVFKTLPEDVLFFKALKVQPVTKKAICEAFDLNIEAICRYKRSREKNGTLKQSKKKVVCQFTGHYAHLLTTNTFLFNSVPFSNE
jgi:hypothetical protein